VVDGVEHSIRAYTSGVIDALPSNGLAFSGRERAADHLQKSTDLARKATSDCMRVFGGCRFFVVVIPPQKAVNTGLGRLGLCIP
jgi:hypothetical protein